MLQQILKQMYIAPELLSELSDDQKQILFIKLREEQIRRWKEEEEKLEESRSKNIHKPKKPPKPGKRVKTVSFLTDKDGQEWVWVMGDHENDISIEQILEKEAQEKAEKLASEEAERLRNEEEQEIERDIAEKMKILEKEKLEREAEIRRKKEEAELYQSLKEARLEAEKLEREKKQKEEEEKKKLQQLSVIQEKSRRKSVERADLLKHRRSSEIYIKWKENRELFEKLAAESSKEVEKSWKEQEKKSKEADQKRREIARQAREEIHGTLTRTSKIIQAANAFQGTGTNRIPPELKPPIPPKNSMPEGVNKMKNILRDQNSVKRSKYRTEPLPPNRKAVLEWFINEEKPKGAGIDPQYNDVAEWFHGIISRGDAEKLLENRKKGSFVVRVSERVWGYTISYKADERLKHFLIDTSSEDGYQFFGANQVRHQSLSELVNFHKETPITLFGEEKLLYPCGQEIKPPDYAELFPQKMEMTSL